MPAQKKFSFGMAVLYSIPVVTFGLGTWQARKVGLKKEHRQQLHDRSQTVVDLPKRFLIALHQFIS